MFSQYLSSVGADSGRVSTDYTRDEGLGDFDFSEKNNGSGGRAGAWSTCKFTVGSVHWPEDRETSDGSD